MSDYLTVETLTVSREITIETLKNLLEEGLLEADIKTPQEIVTFLNDAITYVQDKLLEIEQINDADYSELEFIIQTLFRFDIK